jgi:hypothetical protein
MAGSREINAEHFVGVSAGSQIGAMGPWDYGRGGDRRFHTTSAYHCVRARGAGAPVGELSLDDGNDRVVRCSTSAVGRYCCKSHRADAVELEFKTIEAGRPRSRPSRRRPDRSSSRTKCDGGRRNSDLLPGSGCLRWQSLITEPRHNDDDKTCSLAAHAVRRCSGWREERQLWGAHLLTMSNTSLAEIVGTMPRPRSAKN